MLRPDEVLGEVRLRGRLVPLRRPSPPTAGGDRTRGRSRTSTSSVPAGTRTAIVGETGAGKTTLGYLVGAALRAAARAGDDRRNRRPRRVSLESLAATVGVVSQETYLFHASVRENLRFAWPEASDEEIEDAARTARIHDLIESLPEGYDTVVGERGYRFSGGEKQRMAIARTILRNPPVLVLDEATSSLDTQTEARGPGRARAARPRGARRSRSRTGSRPSATPTRSWCSTTGGSSSAGRTRSCSSRAGHYAALVARDVAEEPV